MGGGASMQKGFVRGHFKTEIGHMRVKPGSVVEYLGEEYEISWMNKFCFTFEFSNNAEIWVYSTMKDGFYQICEKLPHPVSGAFDHDARFWPRCTSIFEGHPKIPLFKYETGRFRSLNIPEEQYNHVNMGKYGTQNAFWLNPCAFHIKMSETRELLYIFASSVDGYLELGDWDKTVTEAKSGDRRLHKRLSPEEGAAEDNETRTNSFLTNSPKSARQKQAEEEQAALDDVISPKGDGPATVVKGKYKGSAGDIKVHTEVVKLNGKKIQIEWLNPYTFHMTVNETDCQMWTYSVSKKGYYQLCDVEMSVSLALSGERFYRLVDGDVPTALTDKPPEAGTFEDMKVPVSSDDMLESGSYGSLKFTWINPMAFHFEVDDSDKQLWVYMPEQTAYIQLGNWENPVYHSRNSLERMHLKLE